MKLKIKATKPQATFHQMPHKFRLFAAGYGSGKSEAMAQSAIMDMCISSQALVACYAPTYDLVRLITASRIQAKLDEHGVRYAYNKQDNIIYTSSPYWGDCIFRTMDNPERIVGYESFSSHLDELDTLKMKHAKDVWEKVMGRNRLQLKGGEHLVNKISAYTTPEGFRFCHWRWVLNKTPDYGMIQAPSYSNPYLPADYIDSLRQSYSEQLVQAYVEGEFVNLTTGTVYNSYNRDRCRSSETIKPQEPLFIGQDFNVGAMSSTVYVKRENGWHAVGELIGIYDTPSLVDVIKSRYAGHQVTIYPDASGNSRKTVNASVSDISLLRTAGFIIKAPNANPPVKDRIMAVNKALSDGVLWVNDRLCPTVANSLEQQAYDKNGEPDKSSGVDHQNDATGYPIAYELPVRRPAAAAPMWG
jgi:hypothetical protein